MPLCGLAPAVLGVEQPMQMHDKVPHMSVVDGAVRGVLPGVVGLRIVGIDADDVERLEVLNSILSSEVSSPPKTR